MNPPQPGAVETVLGPVEPGELGITLTHEHLLIDLAPYIQAPIGASARKIYESPVSQENLGYVRHYSTPSADNARLLDVSVAIEEANLYKQHGGGTMVDATSIGIARDPVGLARISRQTGLHIVMGSSYYVAAFHPPDMDQRSEDSIVDDIVRDVTQGVDGTTIRSGIIGEVGCTWPLTDNERKVVRASGRAQQITGAPLLIHPGRDETAPARIVDILREVGADIERTIMGHLDRTVFQRDTLLALAQTGCYLEWDLFGREVSHYPLSPAVDMPGDAKRMDDIAWIASEGYGDKIVVAHDICSKDRLLSYGGHGYFYILANIVPRMRHRGFDEDAITKILVGNPAAALTFTEPA